MIPENKSLDGEELANAFEANPENFKEVRLSEQEELRKKLKEYKEKRISIRISESVLNLLKEKASKKGFGYQTLINEQLHKLAYEDDEITKIHKQIDLMKEEINDLKKKVG